MYDIAKTLKMSEDFQKIARETLVESFENAARAVNINVVYHRPDAPSLVQEFAWGTDDMLIPAVALIEKITQAQKRFTEASGAFEIENLIMELEDLMQAVEADIEASKELPEQFDLDFKHVPAREHVLMINTVPFQRVQKFLRHWHDQLEDKDTGGGLLNNVRIAHTRIESSRPLISPKVN